MVQLPALPTKELCDLRLGSELLWASVPSSVKGAHIIYLTQWPGEFMTKLTDRLALVGTQMGEGVYVSMVTRELQTPAGISTLRSKLDLSPGASPVSCDPLLTPW